MNKLLTKIVGLSLGLSMAIGVGVAVAVKGSDASSVEAAGSDSMTYSLVTSTDALEAGKSYIITNGTSGTVKTMGVASSPNSRPAVDASVVNSKITRGSTILSVLLGGSDGAWTFATENYGGTAGYFTQGNQTSKNYLKIDSSGDGFTISFDGDAAVITSTVQSSRNIIRYNANNGSPIFSCYTSGQSPIYLWKEAGAASSFTVTYTPNGATSGDVPTDGTSYSSGQTVTVLGNTGSLAKDDYTFSGWTYNGTTYQAGNTLTITSSITFVAAWYHNDSISVVSGKEANTIYTDGTLNLSTCVNAVGDGALSFTVPSVNYLSYDSSTTTVTGDSSNTGGPLTITAYKGQASCTFTVSVTARPTTGTFELYEDTLVEGDYVVCSGTTAMKNATTSAPRIDYETVVVTGDDTIVNPSSSVIWHIAKDGDYWTFYNEDVEKYAAFTSTDGRGTLIDSVTSYADFSIAESTTFDFVNVGKSGKYLRYNNGYGFASYGTSTGATLTLYKKIGAIVPAASVTVNTSDFTKDRASSGTIASILSATVYGSDGSTLATNQHVTWSAETASVITFDNANGTYYVGGAIGSSTNIYATSVDGSILSSNYVTLTVTKPAANILTPGSNGYSDSAEENPITWTNSTKYTSVYYLGIHFEMAGTGSTGQYLSSDSTWRMYQGGNTVLTITAPSGKKIDSLTFVFGTGNGGLLLDSDEDTITSAEAWTPASGEHNSLSFSVGQSGTATNGNVQLKSITVVYSEATLPTVSITHLEDAIVKEDTGTFTATTAHATGVSLSWSSSDDDILYVDTTGEYAALDTGAVTVTVNMTCNEGSASDTYSVSVDAGLITIIKANEICNALTSGQTTDYKVTLKGYISSMSASNYIMICDAKVDSEGATTGNQFEIFGVYSSDPLRNYAVLNGEVTYTGYLTKYNTTNEMAGGAHLDKYEDEAMSFAKFAYEELDDICSSTGLPGIKQSDWEALAEFFDDVDYYSKEKLRAATSSYEYDEFIAKWIGRYTLIVNYGFDDFMEMGISGARIVPTSFFSDSNNVVTIIAIISVISVSTIGGFFFLRKRKEQ